MPFQRECFASVPAEIWKGTCNPPPPPIPTALASWPEVALTPRRASCVVNLHRLVQPRFRKPCSSVLECIVLLKNKWQKGAV